MTQRLFILSPAVIFAARVNQADFVYPLDEITFDTVTAGAFGDIKPGMTVLLGNAAGSDNRGRQRVRKAAATNTLYIGRSSQGVRDGEVNLADNQYITVLDDRRVWAKIPFIDDDGNIFKDSDIAYTDQTDEIPPKANILGGAIAATIGGGDIITVDLNASVSYPVAAGASITGHAWDVDDGTITAGTGTNQITATFPAGFRHVSYTATDSNGKTHTTEIPVYARDPDDSQCVAFQIVEHRITQTGQQLSFRILEDIPISSYPDGTLVILWEGEPSSASDRSNVKFWGWIQSEQLNLAAERTATLKDIVIRCVDIPGRLATLPGFSQSIIGDSAPDSWLKMKSPNMDLFIDYLLRWHSTAFEVGFYRPSGTGSNYPFVILESSGENLWGQASGMAKALVPDYILGANRNGEMWTNPDPMLQSSRTGTVQAALSEDDYTAVNWERMRPPRTHWIWGDAIKADPDEISALFCTAPGQAPGQGEASQQSGRQLAMSQEDLNICEGNRYARINALHVLIPITMVEDVGIEPSEMTWITLTLNSGYSRRQAGFSAARGLPVELNITYNYAREGTTKTVEVLFEEETSGSAAVTYIPPDTEWEPPYDPPIDPPDPPPPIIVGDGFGTNYVMAQNVLIRTRDLSAASPSWSTIETPADGHEFWDFILDPWNPVQNGFLMASDGVYLSEDLDQTTPTFTLIYDIADMEAEIGVGVGTLSRHYQIKGSINVEGFFAFGVNDSMGSTHSKVWCFVTTDYGDTWTAYLAFDDSGAADQRRYSGGMEISPHLSGTAQPLIYMARGTEVSGGNDKTKVLRSTDGGVNWTVRSTGTVNGTNLDIHVPYNDNPNSDHVLIASSGGVNAISDDGGVTFDEPFVVGGTVFHRTPFQTFTQDRQQVYAFTDDGSGNLRRFNVSTDGGQNYEFRSELDEQVRSAGGFPYEGDQFYLVTNSKILVTVDGGFNWIDKTGNAPSFTWSSLGIGGVIVPVWVEE